MIDQKTSIFIRRGQLWVLLVSLLTLLLAGLGLLYYLLFGEVSHGQEIYSSVAALLQTVITGLTIAAVIYLFQSAKNHQYLRLATSTFLRDILPQQFKTHFSRITLPLEERGWFKAQFIRYCPGKHASISPKVFVNHISGSLVGDYLLNYTYPDGIVAIGAMVQLNVRMVFLNLSIPRTSLRAFPYRKESCIEYCFEPGARTLPDTIQKEIKRLGGYPEVFAEAAKIAHDTLGWACALRESTDGVVFSARVQLSETFLHDAAEQLFVANDIASMIRGVADALAPAASAEAQ